MSNGFLNKILTIFIALVWVANGLFCKVLNLEPRHELIVARILGKDYSTVLTKLIGISEIVMFIWILSKFKPRLCSITQIAIVATMNIIEFIFAPDLLLFGRANIIFATIFILVVYVNEFILSVNDKSKNIQCRS